MILRCAKPQCLAYDSNLVPLNGWPLSIFRTSAIPWREKIASNLGRTALAETVVSTSRRGGILQLEKGPGNPLRLLSRVGRAGGSFLVAQVDRGCRKWQLVMEGNSEWFLRPSCRC